MSLSTRISMGNVPLTAVDEARIAHQLGKLDRNLTHFPEPVAEITLAQREGPRQIEVDLRVRLEPHGRHLISHQSAETVDRAVKLAVQDVKRELERQISTQRGEPSYGVPSRRRLE